MFFQNRFSSLYFVIVFLVFTFTLQAQNGSLVGKVTTNGEPLEYVSVHIVGTQVGTATDSMGDYQIKNLIPGQYTIQVSVIGYDKVEKSVRIVASQQQRLDFELGQAGLELGEVVVSGTMKETSKLESPVPVEVYTAKFFKTNPSPTVFEALQNINGVRPQNNCSVCNTGDIHINGLEGPYTMVLIDGMPIVSGLSTVYGLFGIPQSLIERVEVVKGPASTLYGSEAVGGLINVITKSVDNAPLFAADVYGTTWGELNTDFSYKFKAGQNAESLIGVNYFNFSNRVDKNNDGFTDMTLQDRVSVFNKWNFKRKDNRIFTVGGRFIYEDRWGGEMNWEKKYRGGDEVYGENIYTQRWEAFGTYQLPVKEHVLFQFSLNGHDQNSVYGDTDFLAKQNIAFGQLTWNKAIGFNDVLLGLTYRYTYYDDNTPVTASFDDPDKNLPSITNLPGVFVQDEISINKNNKLLLGLRYDYNSLHGSILTPRLNYKWNSIDKTNVFRLSVGNGYRVANVFTEDHAALTGARDVVFLEDLNPETSWNANLNYVKKIFTDNGSVLSWDASLFYTYFDNKIIADYETDPFKVIYGNLDGYAISNGISLNMDYVFSNGLKVLVGGTLLDVYSVENDVKERQLFSERFTATWTLGYTLKKSGITIDYTGNLYSPMRLPLLSDLDPRDEYSPWWSIQNIQLSKSFNNGIEIYVGVKNLLNWTPAKNNPHLIARSFDPFDRNVVFDDNGGVVPTVDNPYALSFDPAYVYAPNQGIRAFLGLRYSFK